MLKRKIISLLVAIISCTVLTGCEDVKWFETNDPTELVALKDNEIKKDTYYVKQGTNFFKVFNPEIGAAKFKSNKVDESRVIPLYDNERLVPSHYIGELIAYSSDKEILSEVILERYKDLGHSIGVWGGTFDANGYFFFEKSKTVVKDSSLGQVLKDSSSEEVRIVAIDGVPVTKDNVNLKSGTITGLEGNQTYTVQMYVGTQYCEYELAADTLMLQSYEIYFYDNSNLDFSSNGYMCFVTPEDLKSGYYNINGQGLFKYFSHHKGDGDDVDMNVSYYESERERLEAYSRQYTIDVNTKVKDMAIRVYYDFNYEIDESEITGCVFSPSGEKYDMERKDTDNLLELALTQAEIGEWTVNVSPKTLPIVDVKVDSTKVEEEATLKQQDFTFTEKATNIVFVAETKGNDEVYGYIVAPDGRTYDMTYDYDKETNTGRIHYEMAFIGVGIYQVKIYYHPTTTDLSEITMVNNMETETDVIYIE